jgi:hypothetical protein
LLLESLYVRPNKTASLKPIFWRGAVAIENAQGLCHGLGTPSTE